MLFIQEIYKVTNIGTTMVQTDSEDGDFSVTKVPYLGSESRNLARFITCVRMQHKIKWVNLFLVKLIFGRHIYVFTVSGFKFRWRVLEGKSRRFRFKRPPLWSSGQSFWLQIQRSRVRFPELPDFLNSSGSGTGSTQPREVNWGATWIKSSGSGLENRD